MLKKIILFLLFYALCFKIAGSLISSAIDKEFIMQDKTRVYLKK